MVYLRLAWRELRASPSRFLFVVLAVAVGVGALTGVRGFSRAFRNMLLADARTLMAADLTVRNFALPTAGQNRVLEDLARQGVRRTWVTETITMAASEAEPQPVLVTLKAVDPAVYPFYGKLTLAPPVKLDAGSAAVSEDLLLRLKTGVGGTVRLGGQPFRVAAVLAAEPDRMTGTLNVGPRLLITRAGLDRTGLITEGSRASERFLFKLPSSGITVEQARRRLKAAFPEATIADYRETHPVITRGLDRATMFLSLVSLIAVIVGSLGAGMAMHAHIRQKIETVAILKCLGARPRQVLLIFGAQTILVGAAGGALGALFGLAVEHAFPLLVARIFPQQPAVVFDPLAALQGFGAGVLTTLLFALPPLVGLGEIRPSVIFRRDMAETRRKLPPRGAWLAGAAILLGLAGLAVSLARIEAWRIGAYFVIALAVGVGALAGIAWLLLAGLRVAGRTLRLPPAVRHGVANLYRPGNQATAVLVALGVGVMFTLTIFLLQTSLLRQIMESAPAGMPNVFLVDIPAAERDAVTTLVKQQPGIVRPPEVMAAVAVRLAKIDGVPVAQRPLQGFSRRFLRTRTVTWMAARPQGSEIVAGAWWQGTAPQVCVSEEPARVLGIRPGMTLEWLVWGRTIHARVACIQRPEPARMTARFEFLFNPGVLESFPAIYYGSLRMRPRDVAGLQRVLYQRFPTVTVINVADVLEMVQQVVDQIGLVYRFLSLFTVLAGAIILAASVAGTRFRRVRETAILKALGATRGRVAAIFSVEFLLLGLVAGAMGTLLANAFTAAVLKGLFDARYSPALLPSLAAVLATAALAAGAGWAASYRILGMKPLAVLRDE